MDNDEYNDAIAVELQNCLTVKSMFEGVEPFTSDFAEAVATSGNSAEARKPDFLGAVDCVATYSIIAQIIGEDDENYDYFDEGLNLWAEYATEIFGGKEADAADAARERSTLMSNQLVELINEDPQAGLDQISANRDRCIELEKVVPEYFSSR